jgi:putative glycerol-1-phosphate prenyltransferase
MENVLSNIFQAKKENKNSLAVLIDPDSLSKEALELQMTSAIKADVDYFFVGGSMITDDCLDETLMFLKENTSIPIIIFPGSVYQVNAKADAILFLSLISGRNPEFLIGKHVLAAPMLKKSGIEILPTGYMLIDSGQPTTASYISGTLPIPNNKPSIAACTAMTGEMLGLQLNFLDAGSGAKNPVTPEMIKATAAVTKNPIIVGGGISSAKQALENWNAGADIVVVGTAFENDPSIIAEISAAKNM